MSPLAIPLADSEFPLNWACLAGLFTGGEEAISAMATIHLYEGRRWLGWFNSPGSYTIARHFVRVARSRSWDGLFPGLNDPPAVSCGQHGEGLKYISAFSGMTMPTGHMACLTMERSKEVESNPLEGRVTNTFDVAYLAMKHVDYTYVKRLPLKTALLGLIPIAVSVVTCVICALVYDWYSFSAILIGIMSSGCATLIIGRARLVIKFVRNPRPHPGHGVLMGVDEVVVIKGEERDVNIITNGRFHLEGDGAVVSIGVCSVLLLVQFLVQLLLIPQGSLFGQIVFFVSLGASWGYNTYLSSLVKEKTQMHILFQTLGNPEILRFRTGTRATMAVFVCLLLFHEVKGFSPEEDRAIRARILRSCLPIDTAIWRRWREKVVQQLLNIDDEFKSLPYLEHNIGEEWEGEVVSGSDRRLLETLLQDAGAAFKEYFRVRARLSGDSGGEELRAHQGGSEGFIYFRLEEIQ